ncbi:MAG TPA: hypothetical protein VF074_01170 [Pyrinomonadaceae bacterium]
MRRELNLILLVALLATTATAQSNQSVYSNLAAKYCRTLQSTSEEGGSYTGRCRGVAGYNLIVEEGDLRTNIKVVPPRGGEKSLDLWTVVSSAFSSLGPKAEWRMTRRGGKLVPVALIVRYNASENVEEPSKTTSYLAVTKITSQEICVTDKISPGLKANEEARRAADSAETKPCLKP